MTSHKSDPAADLSAFESTYRNHKDAVYRYACSLAGAGADAEDLVQEAFLGLLRKRRAVRAEALRSYLLRSVRNAWLDRCRGGARRQDAPLEAAAVVPDRDRGTHPPRILALKQQAQAVARAIAGLPQAEGEVLRLRVFGRLEYAAIGELLDVPGATARTRYRRALERLRALTGRASRD